MSNLSQKTLRDLESSVNPTVKEAGDYILKNWNNIQKETLKDKRDLVTNIDIEVENRLRDKLRILLPEAGFIVEEGINREKERLNWAIDPIDGTKNFVHLLPQFYVQVALIYKSDPILGLVYNPVSEQLFSASRGNGARLNNKLIKVSSAPSLDSAIIDIDFGGNDQIVDWKLEILRKIIKACYRVRISGGFENPYMLTGAVDGSINLNQQNKKKYIVDNAPRIVLFKEAGFDIKFLGNKGNNQVFITSSSALTDELISLIKGV